MPDDGPVRVATWNIRDLTGDPLAVRVVLRRLDADVVCLQEAPRRPLGVLLRTAPLARAAGLRHVVGGRVSGGTALLVGPRTRVRQHREVRLPLARWYHRRRGAAVAAVHCAGLDLAVAILHLPLDAALRREHTGRVLDLLRSGPPSRVGTLVGAGAVVVTGDLNETPGSRCWRDLEPLAGDPATDAGPTFPARRPDRRLDVVLAGRALEVVGYGDGGLDPDLVARASDHRPVLALVRARDVPPA